MKTSKAHFEIFKKECEKWIEIFGLKGWRIEFYHESDMKDARASTSYDVINRTATLYLNIEWKGENITNCLVKVSAFHEVCEVLLCNIRALANYRFSTKDEISEELHRVIRILENCVFK